MGTLNQLWSDGYELKYEFLTRMLGRPGCAPSAAGLALAESVLASMVSTGIVEVALAPVLAYRVVGRLAFEQSCEGLRAELAVRMMGGDGRR